MKVAYLSLAPFISGAERSLQVMIRSAPAAGIEPLLLCPPTAKLIPWCEANGVRYVTVPLVDRDKRHPFRWFNSVARVAHVLHRERVDVIHSNQVWCFAAASTAASLLGIPRVCHMRDEVGVEGIQWWCKSGVEAVICISEHVSKLVQPAWATARRAPRFRTLINPVMLTMVDSVSEVIVEDVMARIEARRLFGLRENTTVFGFVGQVVAVKGVLELIEACRGLVGDKRWHLLVAGHDPHTGRPYEQACRARVEELGLTDRITFAGFLNQMSDFYNAIDVAVVPSLQEPLGRIPLEAAAYGRPSIAFATDGLKETIADGITGWLVPKGDVAALRAALHVAIESPDALLVAGAEARQRVRAGCDPDRYMMELAHLYQELLTNRNSAGYRYHQRQSQITPSRRPQGLL